MKVLILSQYFWPESFRINEIATHLEQSGHEISVLTGIPNYPGGAYFKGYSILSPFREVYQKIKIIRSPLLSRGTGKGIRLALNYLSFAFSATFVALFFCRERYDVVFVYQPSPVTVGIPAVLMKLFRKVPIIFWVQDLWPETLAATGAVRSTWVLRWVGYLVKWIYQHCDLILIQSRTFNTQIKSFGIAPSKIIYFPNSAEKIYQPIKAMSHAPEAQLLPNGFRVMFAGNIGVAQDFETILTAAERLKSKDDIHWIILGDGRMRSWVEKEVKKREIQNNFHILGQFPLEKMAHFFSLADVMLVTLKNDPVFSMTIPAKIQSYLACAKPIIAAVSGEGNLIINESGAGISCASENAVELAGAVLKMYQTPALDRHKLGEKGLAYFNSNFHPGHLIFKLETLMKNLKQSA